MGAAIATAVSGYLVAHLGGFLPPRTHAPTPARRFRRAERSWRFEEHSGERAREPAGGAVPISHGAGCPWPRPASMAPASTATASPEAGDQRVAQPQDTTGSATSSSRKSAKAAAAPARKRGKADTAATEAISRADPARDPRPQSARRGRPGIGRGPGPGSTCQCRCQPAGIKRRAAAAWRHSGRGRRHRPAAADRRFRPARPVLSSRVRSTFRRRPPAPDRRRASADLAPSAQPTSIQPAAIQPAGIQPSAVQSTPVQQPDALTTVEIKSRPVANIDATPAAEPEAPAPEEKGVLSALKHILPDFRRAAAPDEAPRPPAPVGE